MNEGKVIFEESDWERGLWQFDVTWESTLDLIQETAAEFGREVHILELVGDTSEVGFIRMKCNLQNGSSGSFVPAARRKDALCDKIHKIVLAYRRGAEALILRRRNDDYGGNSDTVDQNFFHNKAKTGIVNCSTTQGFAARSGSRSST